MPMVFAQININNVTPSPSAVDGVSHLDVSLFVFECQMELQVLTPISWALVQVFWAHTDMLFPVASIYGISQG